MTRASRTSRSLCAVLALASAVTMPGCQRWREARQARAEAERVELARTPDPITGEATAPDPGLEVVVWTAQDFGYAAARALLPYADRPVPMPEADLQAWRRAGLRVVVVPIDEIDAVLAQAPPIFPVQRERFGQLTRWAPVIRGPRAPATTLGPGDPLPAGRPRLIARAWVEPDLAAGVPRDVVRTELGVQVERDRRTPGSLIEDPGLGTIADEGVIAAALLTGFTTDGRDALVIVGESPDVDWSQLPEPVLATGANASSVGPAAADPSDSSARPPADPTEPTPPSTGTPGGAAIGPGAPPERTLGEWMLTAPGVPARDGRPASAPRRVFVVLIPRTPSPAAADGGPS